jgi:hypothetical protein
VVVAVVMIPPRTNEESTQDRCRKKWRGLLTGFHTTKGHEGHEGNADPSFVFFVNVVVEFLYFFTNFTSAPLTESATKISSFGLTAIICASPNSPGPFPGLPITASTLPFRSIFTS